MSIVAKCLAYYDILKGVLTMSNPYNCIEGGELGHMGGSWFASYCAYDINANNNAYNALQGFPLPPNSLNWQNRSDPKPSVYRFKKTQLWALMPNGSVDKSCTTMQARNTLITQQGAISLHSYWCMWILAHCSKISSARLGLTVPQVHSLLMKSYPFL